MSASILAYRNTTGADPHRVRRAAIMRAHPEIATLSGWDSRPVHRAALALGVQLLLAWSVAQLSGLLRGAALAGVCLLLAWTVGAILAHYGGVVIHEASHNLCARSAFANRWIGIFANLIQLVPYAMTFRRHHMTHHVHLGVIGVDNDLPKPFEQKVVSNRPLRKLVWLFLYPFVGGSLRGYVGAPDRWEVACFVAVVAFDLLLYRLLGPVGLAYLGLSAFLSGSLHPVAAHFIHEHYLWDERQETYSYYGPLNRVTENMGYHVEHHDFFDVPGSRLPELNRLACEFYDPLVSHRSWTGILWSFVTDSRLSHYSRYVRERARVRGAVVETMPHGPGVAS